MSYVAVGISVGIRGMTVCACAYKIDQGVLEGIVILQKLCIDCFFILCHVVFIFF